MRNPFHYFNSSPEVIHLAVTTAARYRSGDLATRPSLLYGKQLPVSSRKFPAGALASIGGFGIAVDNTIHVLNRYRLARSKGKAVNPALAETIKIVGPILMVSTIVLIAGFGSTLLSELPNLRLFGLISIILLATALLANLLILPATISVVEGRSLK
jgi:hypothetical protein